MDIAASSNSNVNRNTRRGVRLTPNRYFHILNRGNNREDLFVDKQNYAFFLRLYGKHVAPVVDTFAYCLMRNHFHLLIRVKESDVERSERYPNSQSTRNDERSDRLDPATRAFTSLFQAYSMAMNKSYGRTGKLFQERFARIPVLSNDYFTNLIFYIHFNPQKHGFVRDFRTWQWSSYPAFLTDRPTHLQRREVLDWFSGRERFIAFHSGVVDETYIKMALTEDKE